MSSVGWSAERDIVTRHARKLCDHGGERLMTTSLPLYLLLLVPLDSRAVRAPARQVACPLRVSPTRSPSESKLRVIFSLKFFLYFRLRTSSHILQEHCNRIHPKSQVHGRSLQTSNKNEDSLSLSISLSHRERKRK